MNIDEILQRTLDLSIEAYEPQTTLGEGIQFISGKGGFPCFVEVENKILYVVLRGTNPDLLGDTRNSLGNILTDLGTDGGVKINSFQIFKERLKTESLVLEGHGEFLRDLSKTYFDIRNEIDYLARNASTMVITGHSAGGALATLFYYIYVNDMKNKDFKLPVYNTVTYGAPRSIKNNPDYVKLYNDSCPDLIRVFNSLDVVTYVPFNKPLVIPLAIANGYTHVGQPLPLDSNIKNNSLDALVLQIINGNKESYKFLMKNYTLDELRENDIMKFITSDEYLAVLMGGTLQCYNNVGIRNVPDEIVTMYSQELFNNAKLLRSYREKCSLGKPYFLEDILLRYKLGETPEQENLALSTVISSAIFANVKMFEAHSTKTYLDNLTILLNREVEKRLDILQPLLKEEMKEGTFVTPVPIPVTPESIDVDLEKEINKDIESGKILGITTDVEYGSMIELS